MTKRKNRELKVKQTGVIEDWLRKSGGVVPRVLIKNPAGRLFRDVFRSQNHLTLERQEVLPETLAEYVIDLKFLSSVGG